MADKHEPRSEKSNDITQSLHDHLSQLEDECQKALNNLRAVQELIHKQLQSEASRLTNKFGKDDPRKKNLIELLDTKRELAEIKVAEIDDKESQIHSRVNKNPIYRKVEFSVFVDHEKDVRLVKGKILDVEDKKGIGGLIIIAFDKDLQFDETLGAAITDPDGEFNISYQAKDFLQGPGPTDETYHFDRASGEITFGDGKQGRHPPTGPTIQASYHHGSGEYSNVMITTRKLDGKPVRFLIFFPD